MEEEENTRQNVQAFIHLLSTIPHAASIEPAEAIKLALLFLRARKFDASRAIELYKAYRHMRYSQQLEHIDPLDEGVRRELLSEKFTVLPHSDPSEPTVLLFSVRRHWPPNSTDRDVLKGILYQLDAAVLDERTQIQGITVIYDMTDAKYSNFDADLSLKLLNLLAGCYPARLRNVFIISAPFWFRPPYHISRLFVRDKIRERILAIEKSQLQRYLSVKTIPISLGGCLRHRHLDWLRICLERMHCNPPADYFSQPSPSFTLANGGPYFYSSSSSAAPTPQHRRRRRSYCQDGDNDAMERTSSAPIRSPSFRSPAGYKTGTAVAGVPRTWRLGSGSCAYNASTISCLPSQRSLSVIRRPYTAAAGSEFSTKRSAAAARLFDLPLANQHSDAGSTTPTPTPPSQRNNSAFPLCAAESGLADGHLATDPKSPFRVPVGDFLARYRSMASSRQFEKEFDAAFKDSPLSGTVNRFQSRSNAPKNRYVDVPCLDQSAVLLPQNGYIHANFVHSYSRKNAYILTQGPLDSTVADFWQMVWFSGASVVVMLTRTVENMRVKCSQYWPEASSSKRASKVLHCGPFTVTNIKETLEADGLYRHSRLCLSKPTECGATGGSCSSMASIDGVDGQCSPRQIDHFLFLGWPDYDVPSSAVGFLTFLDVINQHVARLHSNSDSIPPLIVHCSAGIGRTGTFTSIDIALEQAKEERVVDIRGIVSRMRCQRACTVQTSKQYAFIHQAVYTRLSSDG
uniref:Tyrosine-protein phosphatase non-receptor type 9 n=3 Tax=Schistocephalus solidus TaxID=70667 RepID=A0A0X3PBR1_SCHSO